MEAFADWDLLAVVRSCSSTTTTTTTSTSATTTTTPPPDPHLSPPPPPPNHHPSFPLSPPNPTPPPSTSSHELLFGLPTTLFDPPTTSFLGSQQDLQDICKPSLISNPSTSSCTVNYSSFQSLSSPSSSSLTSPVSSSSSSVLAGGSFKIGEAPQLRRLFRPSQVVFGAPSTTPTSQPQRTKKRKNWVKKVCHVPAEGLSNDMWAWRKYGQKPIKGSPYPRGYYRCSSSKGCLARKQVERNRSDPKMFIVTYTAEHNHPMPTHRNSLAGSTRQKPNTSAGNEAPPSDQPTCFSPSAASLSPPTTEKSESKTEGDEIMKNEDENDMGLSDLMLDDDFYVGFEKIDGEDTGECFSDHFSPPMELPWLTSSSTTATAASGS